MIQHFFVWSTCSFASTRMCAVSVWKCHFKTKRFIIWRILYFGKQRHSNGGLVRWLCPLCGSALVIITLLQKYRFALSPPPFDHTTTPPPLISHKHQFLMPPRALSSFSIHSFPLLLPFFCVLFCLVFLHSIGWNYSVNRCRTTKFTSSIKHEISSWCWCGESAVVVLVDL